VNSNRQRLNFSAEAYQRLFIDIFGGLGNRKVILFGSGRFAQRFLTLYGEDYPVSAVLDNQKARWGTMLGDVTIQSPEMLSDLSVGTYRVIICIKNYLSVVQQLKQMGIQDYAIFDPNRDYPRKHKPVLAQNNQAAESAVAKKYHVGYIAGVFDLFHVGHLNMFKRAREQCDYLIVGVVSDEGVRKFKKTEPFIPFEERIEMVRSCRYVDEARKIPLDYAGTRDAWRMYHFDVQFSGSDYVDNPDWLAEKEFLQKRGADLVFFPYTEQTSSTKIKALIQEKLV
jgi:cytidyltransferase-like protein